MKISYIIIAVVTIALAMPAQAQKKRSGARQNQTEWLKGVRDYKHEMLIKEVELTKEQQEEFFPLYTKMEEEIFEANKQVRDLENKITKSKETVSDLEYGKAAEAMVEVSAKTAAIEGEYFEKFSKILSNEQLFKLKRAEKRFTKSMISRSKAAKK